MSHTPRTPGASRRNVSTRSAPELALGDHQKAVLLEVTIAIRSGTAVGPVPPAGPGLPLPPIEEDLNPPRAAVEAGPGRPEFRAIACDDNEPPPHVTSPPHGGRDDERAVPGRRRVRPPV